MIDDALLQVVEEVRVERAELRRVAGEVALIPRAFVRVVLIAQLPVLEPTLVEIILRALLPPLRQVVVEDEPGVRVLGVREERVALLGRPVHEVGDADGAEGAQPRHHLCAPLLAEPQPVLAAELGRKRAARRPRPLAALQVADAVDLSADRFLERRHPVAGVHARYERFLSHHTEQPARLLRVLWLALVAPLRVHAPLLHWQELTRALVDRHHPVLGAHEAQAALLMVLIEKEHLLECNGRGLGDRRHVLRADLLTRSRVGRERDVEHRAIARRHSVMGAPRAVSAGTTNSKAFCGGGGVQRATSASAAASSAAAAAASFSALSAMSRRPRAPAPSAPTDHRRGCGLTATSPDPRRKAAATD
eukprot:4545025-Prymnesium_polylepis.1